MVYRAARRAGIVGAIFPLLLNAAFARNGAAQSASTLSALIDRARLVAGTDSFTVLMQGKPVGWQRHSRRALSDGWEIRDAVSLGAVMQESIVLLDGMGHERSLRQTGSMRNKPMAIALDFAPHARGLSVRGTADTPTNPNGALRVDTVVAAGTVDDNAVTPLLAAVPWQHDTDVQVPVLASGKGTVDMVTLKVLAADSVVVPAGRFQVWRVLQQSGSSRVTFEITRKAPYRLVRMQPTGTPLEIVLAGARGTSDAFQR